MPLVHFLKEGALFRWHTSIEDTIMTFSIFRDFLLSFQIHHSSYPICPLGTNCQCDSSNLLSHWGDWDDPKDYMETRPCSLYWFKYRESWHIEIVNDNEMEGGWGMFSLQEFFKLHLVCSWILLFGIYPCSNFFEVYFLFRAPSCLSLL